MKNTINEIKNTLEEINSRLGDTEEWIHKLDDRVVEITEAKQKKRKRNENSLRYFYDNIKHKSICITGGPEAKE